MKHIDAIDTRFIEENCPKDLVPAFIVKSSKKPFDVHKKIMIVYAKAEQALGYKFPKHSTTQKIVNLKHKKDEYVSVYYTTAAERAALYDEKHRLMYFKFTNNDFLDTVCYSFNNKNEPIDTMSIPVGKIKSSKDVTKITDNMRKYLVQDCFLRVTPTSENTYELAFLAARSKDCSIGEIKKACLEVQTALFKEFSSNELTLCDANGNDYLKTKQRKIVADLYKNCLTNHRKHLFRLPEFLTAHEISELETDTKKDAIGKESPTKQ